MSSTDERLPMDRPYTAEEAIELVALLQRLQNEVKEYAIGYHDAYVNFYIWVGGRGTGSMIEGCGSSYGTEPTTRLLDALREFWKAYDSGKWKP